MSVTMGFPCVSVPVLSNAIALKPPAASSAAPPLNSTPARAAALIALTMLTGVEITSAHGQAITSSVSARYSQVAQSPPSASGGSTNTSSASAMTAGV